jgi:hypothetical protein
MDFRRYVHDHDEHLQHIVDAAPQLQELWLVTNYFSSPEQLACLTGLRSLSSLELSIHEEAAQAVRSLTDLQGLMHLSLGAEQLDDLMPAVGQLTGLVSLELWGNWRCRLLQPLAALQWLTSLTLKGCTIDEQQAQVLAGLGQLRRLVADFNSPSAAAAAGLARLEECRMDFNKGEEEEKDDDEGEEELQGGALVQAPGQLRTDTRCLACFDISSMHTLELEWFDQDEGGALRQQLPRCPQLRALHLVHIKAFQPEVLQAIAALPQLQHLCLRAWDTTSPQLGCGRLVVLAGGSRQLRQLTLMGMADLPESTLVALMVGLPQLRLLCLLCCSAALSQGRCQALVGQLQLYELQVDVVVDDWSASAGWMMTQLAERWRDVS